VSVNRYCEPIIASGNSIFVTIGHLFVRRNRITQLPAMRTVDEHNELKQEYIDVCSFLSAIFAKSINLCQQTIVVLSVCLSVRQQVVFLSIYCRYIHLSSIIQLLTETNWIVAKTQRFSSTLNQTLELSLSACYRCGFANYLSVLQSALFFNFANVVAAISNIHSTEDPFHCILSSMVTSD